MVGGVFLLVGLWLWLLRRYPMRLWSLVPGAVLVLLGLFFPGFLRYVHRFWMLCAEILGWVNTRLILGVLFYVVVFPTSIMLRLLGKDLMGRHLDSRSQTYRVAKSRRPPNHMERQF